MIELSVVIPTRNRCKFLSNCLDSINKQSLDKSKFEVIVIDNGSTDETKKIVDSFQSLFPNLIYFYEDKPGLHNGRHDGYRLAKSNILVYADDDIIAFPTWLETINEEFKDEGIFLVGGNNLPLFEEKPPFWLLAKWYSLCEYGHCLPYLSIIDFGASRKEISPYYVFGCNFAVRKQIIEDAGGFHPDGVPFEMVQFRGDGETYIAKYIIEKGLRTIFNPKASVYHQVPKERLTIDYFSQWSFKSGIVRSYDELRYGNKKVTKTSWAKRMKKLVKILFGIEIVRILEQLVSQGKSIEINRELDYYEKLGYEFHQKLYFHSEEIRQWVHRPNYWE